MPRRKTCSTPWRRASPERCVAAQRLAPICDVDLAQITFKALLLIGDTNKAMQVFESITRTMTVARMRRCAWLRVSVHPLVAAAQLLPRPIRRPPPHRRPRPPPRCVSVVSHPRLTAVCNTQPAPTPPGATAPPPTPPVPTPVGAAPTTVDNATNNNNNNSDPCNVYSASGCAGCVAAVDGVTCKWCPLPDRLDCTLRDVPCGGSIRTVAGCSPQAPTPPGAPGPTPLVLVPTPPAPTPPLGPECPPGSEGCPCLGQSVCEYKELWCPDGTCVVDPEYTTAANTLLLGCAAVLAPLLATLF